MTLSEIIQTQEHIGTKGDGFWGPMSIKACQKHLKDLMPSSARFPVEGTKEFIAFYGPHGEKDGFTPPGKKIQLPFALHLFGDQNRLVKTLTPHEKCVDSLLAVFERLAVAFPNIESRMAAGILDYFGIYNPRFKRGSTNSWSMHAWMNAIDLNPSRNGNRIAWPITAKMPIEVMECFVLEGWLPAGAFWGRDAMHFQATSPM